MDSFSSRIQVIRVADNSNTPAPDTPCAKPARTALPCTGQVWKADDWLAAVPG
jgi:hypothetical protein